VEVGDEAVFHDREIPVEQANTFGYLKNIGPKMNHKRAGAKINTGPL
jgi:hypothetical protein